MTVAAGFHVNDGVLLCADTLYTGDANVHQEKLFSWPVGDDCKIAFGMAGSEAYAKMAIEDILDAVRQSKHTLIKIKATLRSTIKRFTEEYIDSRPWEEREGARFQLLIAVWLNSENKPLLYSTYGTAMMPVDKYDCVGIGAHLARYIIAPFFDSDTSSLLTDNAITLAHCLMSATKRHVPGCGGDTTVLLVKNDGTIEEPIRYLYHAPTVESLINVFHWRAETFLLEIARTLKDDGRFMDRRDQFLMYIDGLRKGWREERHAERTATSLTPKAQSSPESPKRDQSHPQPSPESPGGTDGS